MDRVALATLRRKRANVYDTKAQAQPLFPPPSSLPILRGSRNVGKFRPRGQNLQKRSRCEAKCLKGAQREAQD